MAVPLSFLQVVKLVLNTAKHVVNFTKRKKKKMHRITLFWLNYVVCSFLFKKLIFTIAMRVRVIPGIIIIVGVFAC